MTVCPATREPNKYTDFTSHMIQEKGNKYRFFQSWHIIQMDNRYKMAALESVMIKGLPQELGQKTWRCNGARETDSVVFWMVHAKKESWQKERKCSQRNLLAYLWNGIGQPYDPPKGLIDTLSLNRDHLFEFLYWEGIRKKKEASLDLKTDSWRSTATSGVPPPVSHLSDTFRSGNLYVSDLKRGFSDPIYQVYIIFLSNKSIFYPHLIHHHSCEDPPLQATA